MSGQNGALLSKGLSHLILEITELEPGESAADYYRNFSYKINGASNTDVVMEIKTYVADPNNDGNTNPGLPADIFGIKMDMPDAVDVRTLEFSFESEMAPVWGDFYAKDGNNTDPPTAAWNDYNDITPALAADGLFDSLGYIARPNGEEIHGPPPPVPEPTSLVIWGIGLLACMAVRFVRRRV
ncbi:MAG: PEP-CTERM sorting domain-containing protein [Pirellulales bacterium]|nr:PEP-CTERM sorting domain-containing protein [Pirellulales bacterium]